MASSLLLLLILQSLLVASSTDFLLASYHSNSRGDSRNSNGRGNIQSIQSVDARGSAKHVREPPIIFNAGPLSHQNKPIDRQETVPHPYYHNLVRQLPPSLQNHKQEGDERDEEKLHITFTLPVLITLDKDRDGDRTNSILSFNESIGSSEPERTTTLMTMDDQGRRQDTSQHILDLGMINLNGGSGNLGDSSGVGSMGNDNVQQQQQVAWPSDTPFDHPHIRTLFIVLYSVVFVASILGNLLVIFVILRHRRMRTVINCFLANLALSDLLVGVFCVLPNLYSYLSPYWHLGRVMCKLYYSVQNVCYTASIIVMTVISLERYVAIIHPMFNRRLTRMWVRNMTSAVIWLVAIVCGVPLALVYDVVTFQDVDADGHVISLTPFCVRVVKIDMTAYTTTNFILWYCGPLAIITFFYSRIARVLWHTTTDVLSSDDAAATAAAAAVVTTLQPSGSISRLHFRTNHQARGASAALNGVPISISAAAVAAAMASSKTLASANAIAASSHLGSKGDRESSSSSSKQSGSRGGGGQAHGIIAACDAQLIENDYKPKHASTEGRGGAWRTSASLSLRRMMMGGEQQCVTSDGSSLQHKYLQSSSSFSVRQSRHQQSSDRNERKRNPAAASSASIAVAADCRMMQSTTNVTDRFPSSCCKLCGKPLGDNEGKTSASSSSGTRGCGGNSTTRRRRSDSDTSTRLRSCPLSSCCGSGRRRSGSQSDINAAATDRYVSRSELTDVTSWLESNVDGGVGEGGGGQYSRDPLSRDSNIAGEATDGDGCGRGHTVRDGLTRSASEHTHASGTTGSSRPSRDSVQQMATNRRYFPPHTDVIQVRRKVVKLLLAVISSFALCSLPYQMYAMWQTWSPSTRKAAGNVTSISFAELLLPPITFLALYFNSCLNPVLYALLSENFRKYLRELCGSHLLLLPIVRAHMRRRARQRRQQQYAMYIMVDGRRVSLGHNSCCTSQT